MEPPLVDQEARRRIVEETERSMGVEAAAGTGKTTLMVGRILRLLERGVRPSQLAAITFTELAAAQLKSRLRAALEASELPAHRAALEELEAAQISTIHAMAVAILKERPIEAGLDPGFTTVDQAMAGELFDELWRSWLARETGQPPEASGAGALRAAFAAGLTLGQLRGAAEALYAHRDVVLADALAWERAQAALSSAEATRQEAAATLREKVDHLLRLSRLASGNDRLAAAAAQLAAELARDPLPSRETPAAEPAEAPRLVRWARRFVERVPALERSVKTLGNQQNWPDKQILAQARALLAEIGEAIQALRVAAEGAVAQQAVAWLAGFVEWAQQEKRRRGLADFLDQLLWCRDLLRDQVTVRRHFQQRFRTVLVDEFQDTDPLQAEIVLFLAEDPHEPPATRWDRVRVGPGRLFIVGDPKQSIYRFRRADVETYRQASALIGAEGSHETIRQNFRTVPAITTAVNTWFDPWMGPATASVVYQPAYVALEPFRPQPERETADPPPGAYRLELSGDAFSEPQGERVRADEVRRIEAETVARALSQLIGQRRIKVHEEGGWRDASFGDAVILLPTFTGVDAFEDALAEHSVPYRVVGGRLFFARSEIRELSMVLAAVSDPYDELAVVGALRSGLFGVSDAELWAFKQAGGRFDPLAQAPEPAASAAMRVAEGLARIRDWHRQCVSVPASSAVRRIMDETGYLPWLRLAPAGAQAVANVEKLLAQAAAFEASGESFGGFVRWLRGRAPGGAWQAEEEDSPVWSDEAAVRVMTIHKAKGLEFPIVFVANLSSGRLDPGSVVVDRDRGRIELRIGPARGGMHTPGWEEASAKEEQRLAAERVRLYYVALTRARDYLFVSGVERKGGFWEELVRAGGEAMAGAVPAFRPDAGGRVLGEVTTGAGGPEGQEGAPAPEDFEAALAQWRAWRQSVLGQARQGLRIVAAREAGRLVPAAEESAAAGETGTQGAEGAPDEAADAFAMPRPAEAYDGTAMGQAFHEVMERLAGDAFRTEAGARLGRYVASAALHWGLGREAQSQILEWAHRALSGELGERARAARRIMAEVPFVFEQDQGMLVEGRMDLVLLDHDGGVTVVDYKTHQMDPRALGREYGPQLAVYAGALRRAMGTGVPEGPGVRASLYAARAAVLVDVPAGPLAT